MAVAISLSVVVAPLAHADDTTPGSFNAVQPARVLDTRSGVGSPKLAVAAGATLTFTATAGIADPVGAVVMEVTAVNPKNAGYLTVFAAGATRPTASNLNFLPGQTVPNLVVTPTSSAGKVSVYNGSKGTVDVLADLHGFFVGGANTAVEGTYVPMAAHRVLDTRIGLGAAKKPAGPDSTTVIKVAGTAGIPAAASAVVVNVTAVASQTVGYVTVFPGSPTPDSSTLNYEKGKTRANLGLIEVNPTDGTLSLFNGSHGSTDLVADVTGYFVGGTPATDGTFIASTPYRPFDSRVTGGRPAGALSTSRIRIFPLDPVTGLPDPTFSVFKAVVVNVTVSQPEAAGFLTTWDGLAKQPAVSNSNFVPGQNAAGSVVVPVNPDGTISIYNGSFGNTDLVVDVTGFFLNFPTIQPNVAKAGSPSTALRIASALSKMRQFAQHPASTPVSVTTTR